MRFSTLFFYTCIVVIFVTCNDKREVNQSAVKELSEEEKKDKYVQLWKKKLITEINLSDLKGGVDSFEMRFRATSAIVKFPERLYVLKYSNNEWRCFEYSYQRKEVPDDNSSSNYLSDLLQKEIKKLRVDSFSSKRIYPKSSWENLIDSLLFYGITSLPDQIEIVGYKNKIFDGVGYNFEIATSKGYREIFYREPQFYNDDYNKRMTKILRLLEYELDFPVILDTNSNSPIRTIL